MKSRAVIGRASHVTGGRSVVGQLRENSSMRLTQQQNKTQANSGFWGVAQEIITAQPTSDLVMNVDTARVSDVELVPRGRIKSQ